MKNIPKNFQDLFADETRAFLFLATTMDDGSPQVTPVWFNTDGQYLLINSAKGRIKDRNMRNRPRIAVAIMDPKDPYRYIQLRGKVVEITEEGARQHINTLAKKYRLTEFRNFIEILEGDYTLLADIPQWVGLKQLRPNVRHIGPLPYRSRSQIPAALARIPQDRPLVFFAMGSSGKPQLIRMIIEGFRGRPYSV